jgi:hypothetical protein
MWYEQTEQGYSRDHDRMKSRKSCCCDGDGRFGKAAAVV